MTPLHAFVKVEELWKAGIGPSRTFGSCIDEMDSSCDSVGINVPESLLAGIKGEPIMGHDTRIAVDVAKAVFEVAISDRPGHVVRRERLKIESLGHQVVLLPPHHVRPYVRGNKTDRTDAKGILEASRNEDIHPVPVKTVAQQVLTSLHRLRSGWVAERTARLNALRGLLRELGFFIEARIKQTETQLEATAQQIPAVALLRTVPGIGPLTSTALVASSATSSASPRISKRGDGYLRTLLIHGARSVLLHARKAQPDRLRLWAHTLDKTHVPNKAAVAVANKMARIVWAVWSRYALRLPT